MNETTITVGSSDEDVRRAVDTIITPERADEEGKVLAELLIELTDPNDDRKWHLANVAARHAFEKTDTYQDAFRKWAGYDSEGYSSNRFMETLAGEM